MKNIDNISIENAKFIFATNFSGTQKEFNREGDRNFNVIIPEELVPSLERDGWLVKATKPRTENDIIEHYMPVAVKYPVSYPQLWPKIYMITRKNKVLLDERTVGALDNSDIKNVDLVIRPHQYSVNGKEGIKAFVKTMYVTIQEDAFADKYDFEEDEENPF